METTSKAREWYFLAAGTQAGPINPTHFTELVQTGVVTPTTPVWTAGLPTWVPYGALPVDLPDTDLAGFQTCSSCGRLLSTDDLIDFRSHRLCGQCKPIYLQRLKEGLLPTFAAIPAYEGNCAGFWIRVGAKMIDSFILWIFNSLVSVGLVLAVFGTGVSRPADLEDPQFMWVFLMLYGGLFAVQFASAAVYSTWMVGKYGATLGKMACGLRISTPTGPPGYSRALGRYAAEIVSGLMLGIGYLMVAFDPERRAFHDRICNTWVIMV